MNKQFEKNIEEAKKISLASGEKTKIKNALIALMSKKAESPLIKRVFGYVLKPVYVAIFAILIGGGGTAFAAEASLPGEILYPVKIYVNEKTRGAFSFTDEQKANWEVRRAGRRLEEMKKLEEKGRLNEVVQTKIENNFKRHEEKINAVIRKLEEKNNPNAAKIRIKLQNSTEVHKNILEKLETKKQQIEKKLLEKEKRDAKEVKPHTPANENKKPKKSKNEK